MTPLAGVSVAGVETCVEVPSLKLVLDMGRCTRNAVGLPTVLVSHGHLDHCGALPQHAARRHMMNMEVPTYVVPAAIVDDVERMFNAAGALDGNPIARKVVPLRPGEELRLSGKRVVRAFETFHRVVSQGYTVWEKRHRLKPEFVGLPGEQLGKLRQDGVAVDVPVEVPVLSFTGDTRVEVLERVPELQTVETLVMEVSFLDERIDVPRAREMGHIHLDEVIDRRALLPKTDVVFCHFSARYAPQDVVALLEQRLPDELKGFVRPLL